MTKHSPTNLWDTSVNKMDKNPCSLEKETISNTKLVKYMVC